jgi:hypothetical protein
MSRHICVADCFTNCDSPLWDADQPGDVISRTEIAAATGPVRSVASYRIQNMGDTVHEGGGGAGGSIVVKALCCKAEGRGFETRCEFFFPI